MTKQVLEEVLHELNFLHGLHAIDGFGIYGMNLHHGPAAAWDAFCDKCFQLDCSALIKKVEVALSEPLLMDELRNALLNLSVEFDHLVDHGAEPCDEDCAEEARTALARYEKEVG